MRVFVILFGLRELFFKLSFTFLGNKGGNQSEFASNQRESAEELQMHL